MPNIKLMLLFDLNLQEMKAVLNIYLVFIDSNIYGNSLIRFYECYLIGQHKINSVQIIIV
jgi:hypothetical protein